MKNLIPAHLCAVILIALLAGCGYRLQTKANLPFDTITIGKVENSTFEPKLQDRLSALLAQTFMEYGIAVVPSSRHVVQANVVRFELRTLSEVNLTTSEYEVIITSDFVITDTSTGDTFPLMRLKDPYLTYFFATGALENVLAQKEIATDVALRDLSREVVRRAVYRSWKEKEAPQ
ncbi:MAG: LPS assembly lipoprotein LptE [Chloroflexota bacterium]